MTPPLRPSPDQDAETALADRSSTVALLCYCARPQRDEKTAARIETLVTRDIDWERFERLADRHQVVPLVHRALNATDSPHVPDGVLSALSADRERITRHNLAMTRELVAVLDSLGDQGIAAVPVKGPALAATVYDDIGLRVFGDLDVLCAPADIFQAANLLQTRGYEYLKGVGEMPEEAVRRYLTAVPLKRASDGVVVDLHWRLTPRWLPFRVSSPRPERRTDTASIGGTDVPVLSSEDSLLFLTIHGTTHQWYRLGWICDVAASVQRRDIDWSRLLDRARNRGVRRMLRLGVLLARDLLGIDLPPAVANTGRDVVVERLAEEVQARLFGARRRDASFAARQAFQVRALERDPDKIRLLTNLLTTPGIPDLQRVALPSSLVGLYRAFPLLRGLHECGRRFLARG